MKLLISFVSGVLFSIGLIISGMINPSKVLAFLSITTNWDPSLILVMASAIAVYGSAYFFIKKRRSPIVEKKFDLPLKKHIDKTLIVGAAIFGIGWGIAGICPGPAIVNLARGEMSFFVFFISMVVGMKLFHFIKNKL